METSQIILNMSDEFDRSEEVLVEVRGRPPSRGGHVILASGSQHSQEQQLVQYKIEDDDFNDMGRLGYIESRVVTSTLQTTRHLQPQPDSGEIDLDEFMDIVTIKCRSCNFLCSTKPQLVEHVRLAHRSPPDNSRVKEDEIRNYKDVSEEQRQLISSLLALGSDDPHGQKSGNLERPEFVEGIVQSETVAASPESSVYLCGECSLAFTSIAKCNEHVVQVHQRPRLVFGLENSSTVVQFDKSSTTKNRFSSPSIIKPRTILPNVKSSSHFRSPLGISSNHEKIESTSTVITTSKRHRKPVKKFDDFVVENPIRNLISEMKRAGHQDEMRCLVKGCNYLFTKDKLSVHMSCHIKRTENGDTATSKFVFSCPECRNKFLNWRNCAMHLWRSHQIDVDLLTCSVCNEYKTIIPARLENHMLIHSDDRPFSCSVCKSKFKQLAQLKNHSVIHMDKEKDMVPMWYSKKQCNLCDKFFADSKCLKKHVQAVHSKLKPYICQVCNHQSARKAMLEMHMRQHTGEKPFSCDICEYRTGDHNSLRRHKMIHSSGQKPYKCPFCQYSSIQSAAYKNHVTIKHSQEAASQAGIYVCGQCPYKALNLDNFIGHQRTHIETTPLNEVNQDAEASESMDSITENHSNLDESNSSLSIGAEDSEHRNLGHVTLSTSPSAKVSKQSRETKFRSPKKSSFEQIKSRFNKNRRRLVTSRPVTEEEDSLHATTDLGGTTIPAENTS